MTAPLEEQRYEDYVDRVARGAGITSFGRVVDRGLSFLIQLALARMYGPTALGFYTLGYTLVRIANVLAQFGMDNGVVRFVAQHRARKDVSRVRGTILLALCVSLALSTMISSLVFFGAAFVAGQVFHHPAFENVLRIFSLSIPCFTLMSMALWATQGFQTVKHRALVQHILRPLANLLLIVVLYLLGAQILGAAVAFVLSMAVGAILALYYLRRIFPELLDKSTPARFEPRAMFSVSGPMIVANFTQYLYSWTAVIFLGIFATASAVGIYNIAANTAGLSSLVLVTFTLIFAPVVANLHGSGLREDLRRLYQDVSRWTFTGSLPLFLITVLLAKDVMAIFGSRFTSGSIALAIMAIAQLYNASAGPTNRLLAMTGNQRVILLATLASAAASLGGGILLIPTYGVLGAAISTAVAIIALNTVALASVRRRLGLWPYSREDLKPLAAGIASAAATLLAKALIPLPGGLPTIVVLTPILLTSFAAVLVVLGLSSSDRQFIKALWTAVRRVTKRSA